MIPAIPAEVYAGYVKPVHLFVTRSFWMTLTGLTVLLGAGEPVFRPFVMALAPLLGWDVEVIVELLVTAAPPILWVAALHQRSGVTRPYTMNVRAEWY